MEKLLEAFSWKQQLDTYSLLKHLESVAISVEEFLLFVERKISLLEKSERIKGDWISCPYCESVLRISEVNTHEKNKIEENPELSTVIYCPRERSCGFQAFSTLSLKEVLLAARYKSKEEFLSLFKEVE